MRLWDSEHRSNGRSEMQFLHSSLSYWDERFVGSYSSRRLVDSQLFKGQSLGMHPARRKLRMYRRNTTV